MSNDTSTGKIKMIYAQKLGGVSFEVIEVDRYTDASVWRNGRREGRECSWGMYHATWDEARAWAVKLCDADVVAARNALNRAVGVLGNVVGARPPEGWVNP